MEKIIQWDREHSSRFLPTALLIPDKELANLQAYLLKHDLSMNRCLQLLLEDHVSIEEASIANLRTAYQARNLFLQPKYFRVDAEVWYRFGVLARLAGISRCRLFIAMITNRWVSKNSKVLELLHAKICYTEILHLAPKLAQIKRHFTRRPPAREPPFPREGHSSLS